MKPSETQAYALHAIRTLEYCRAPIGGDFHALDRSQVDLLLACAVQAKYRKPRNANGSRARYFHAMLQRRAARKTREEWAKPMSKSDNVIRRGFEAGNYANAYETVDYEQAMSKLSPNRSAEYIAAFTLGFFNSYERDEMGRDVDSYEQALEQVGQRAKQIGIIDE